MRRWWQLGTRNWSVDRGPAVATVVVMALGVAIVLAITSFYESALTMIRREVVTRWLGESHLSIAPPGAHWGQLEAAFAEKVARIDGVREVTAKLIRRVVVLPKGQEEAGPDHRVHWIEIIGIDPATIAPFWTPSGLTGRIPGAEERGALVMEKPLADELGFSLGDTVELAPYDTAPPTPFTITGLIESRRVAEFQHPIVYVHIADLQALKRQPGQATVIEVRINDPSQEGLRRCEAALRDLIRREIQPYEVHSAATRLAQLDEAERITRLIVVLAASVTLLAAFFIMLTTTSAALYKQSRLLGVMRCVGFTRAQIAGLVAVQTTPPTVLGALLGLPLGWGLVRLGLLLAVEVKFEGNAATAWEVPLSGWGVRIAMTAAGIVWALSQAILMMQVCSVSPMRAATPEARPASRRLLWATFGAGALLIAVHEYLTHGGMNPAHWTRGPGIFAGMLTLVIGFVLTAPAVVSLLGSGFAAIGGGLLLLRPALARDQVGKSPWLSACVCWVLMAGLSLIVFTAVRSQGILVFWDFPSRLPEAFVWTYDHVPYSAVEAASRLPGVGKMTVTTDVDCTIEPVRADGSRQNPLLTAIFDKLTRPVYVAGDVDTFLDLAKLGFAESDTEEIRSLMHAGGYVLVPPQTARSKGIRKGDRVRVTINDISHEFVVADVVQSPALDLAVNFFGAENYMQFAASSAVLGTREDLVKHFGVDRVAMMMCNFRLEPSDVPELFRADDPPSESSPRGVTRLALEWLPRLPEIREEWSGFEDEVLRWASSAEGMPPADAVPALERFRRAFGYICRRWENTLPEERWKAFRERLVLMNIAYTLERPDAIVGSISRMREMLERDLRRGVTLITWAPTFALAVASLGIANLMMVRVRMRAKAIAMLRAVGMTRSQTLRLVFSEAVTLGLLGSVTGVGLGFALARFANAISLSVAGVEVPWIIPWGTIVKAVLVTLSVCVCAAIQPARTAAKDNVLEALQVE